MSSSLVTSPIVVGVDESEQSLRATEWAAARALVRGCPLLLIHTVSPEMYGFRDIPESVGSTVQRALDRAREVAPGVEATAETVVGYPSQTLIKESRAAAMLVVGNRGRGGFAELLLGSVGVQVTAHAQCPVVVVRPEEAPTEQWDAPATGQVVVGVDGSAHSDDALGFAFEEAATRGVGLAAVHAWAGPVSTGPGDMLPLVYDFDDAREEERRLLAETVAGWQEKYPDVLVRRLVVRGAAAKQLVRFSHGAELLVVGARGLGGFLGLALGSVSQAAIHHAACSVAVVRTASPV